MTEEVQTVDLLGRLQTLAKRGMQINVPLVRLDTFMDWYFDDALWDTRKYPTEREGFERYFQDRLRQIIEACEEEVRRNRLHVPGSTEGQLMVPGTEVL